ncbi:MAG: hypothetical protein JWO06_820 [Bacteroidota bacterium]|nr:hypothetical protein [Bacteroidota bacterium]
MFANAFKTESGLVKLFELTGDDKEYDEHWLSKSTGIKNITEARSRLRKLLFKSMRGYRQDADVNQQLRDAMTDIDFLIRKGLNEEARKEIHKAWKLAEKNELYNFMAELLCRLSEVNHQTLKFDKLAIDFDSLYAQLNNALAMQQELYRAMVYNQQIGHFVRSANYHSTEGLLNYLAKVIVELKAQLENVRAPKARLTLRIALATCYQVLGNYDEAIPIYSQIREMFNKTPSLIDFNPNGYIGFLNNYLIITLYDLHLKEISLQLMDEIENGFARLKNFFEHTPDRLNYFRQRFNTNKLSYAKTHKEWKIIAGLDLDVKKHLDDPDREQRVVNALQVSTLISCYYEQANYKKAFEWISIYYTLDDAKTLKPLMIAVRFLEVLTYYSTRQFDISDNKAGNLYKTLVEQKFTDAYYKALGVMLRKLNHWDSKAKGDKKEISVLIAAFTKLKESEDGPYIIYVEYFEPIEILEKILNGLG